MKERKKSRIPILSLPIIPRDTTILLQPATEEEIKKGEYITINWMKYSIDPSKIAVLTGDQKGG